MAELEQFSYESFVDAWQSRQDVIVVEGTLQVDGAYYVINRDPRNPSNLVRVRRSDVMNTVKINTLSSAGGERQTYHVSIKRGVPIQTVSLTKSDYLVQPLGAQLFNDTVSVNFVNKTGFTEIFTVIDKGTGQQLYYGQLENGASTGYLSVSTDGTYGQVTYQYLGQAQPTISGLLSDGETYEMY